MLIKIYPFKESMMLISETRLRKFIHL